MSAWRIVFFLRKVVEYLIEREHRTSHLAAIVQGDAHAVVDLSKELDAPIQRINLSEPNSRGFAG